MSKCVKRLINRLWQNEPISAFPEGGIMMWPGPRRSREPREGQQAPYLLGIFFSQICGKDFMICALWRRQKRRTSSSSWHRSIIWTYLNFLGNEIFQWKIVSYAETWRNWSTAKEQLAQNCRKVHLGNNTRSSGDLLWISRHWIFTCRAIFLV